MSDPEVPRSEKPSDVDDVVGSANEGLDAAAAARADVSQTPPDAVSREQSRSDVDPDLAAFEEAEQSYPGTFATPELNAMAEADAKADAERKADADRAAYGDAQETSVIAARPAHQDSAMAGAAYAASDHTETRVVPSEPVAAEPVVVAAPMQQPIFVQAPEPPRERGNRGTAGAIGLLATLAFAILYLGATLGLGAIAGDVSADNFGDAALAPLTTWGFWVPVVLFFLGFWLLGAVINRGRWGLWVIFGIVVGVIAYAGNILGRLFEEPFWLLTPSEGAELVGSQMLAPLAIAAFVFARELTIWFGAWVARSGARKTELNEEAQREYERTLEAGPTLAR